MMELETQRKKIFDQTVKILIRESLRKLQTISNLNSLTWSKGLYMIYSSKVNKYSIEMNKYVANQSY